MKRTSLLLLVLAIACSNPEQEPPQEEELAPIGPGSDSSTLIPPDTPESRRNPSSSTQPRDTTQ
ncbi:MAG TPA: hypothetical protein VGD27_00335 [Longimicrobiales bacterium]